MKTRILQLFVVVILVFAQISMTSATLGPVHVELNMTKPKIAAARANTLTAFKIFVRYNLNLKIHDWMKIWFPVDESAAYDNPQDYLKNICDGIMPIEQLQANPRFVPTDDYFKKYEFADLKNISKIYKNIDERGQTEYISLPNLNGFKNWEDICSSETGKSRIIKDPSGLGCWMLGTLMPSMPIEQTARMERLKVLSRGLSFGYSPCSECQGYPIFVNTCKERSLQFNTPLELEAWRKGYNTIDFNTSKSTCIIAPAIAGRYRLAVADKVEPEPVESEAFVLPCSDISDVEFRDDGAAKENVKFTLNFTTGEGGALDGGSSTIMIKLPKNFVLPKKFPAKCIMVNDRYVTSQPQITADQLTLVVPTDILNLGKAEITFLDSTGITINNVDDPATVEVSTSSEPNFIKSKPFKPESSPFTSLVPNTEYSNSWIRIRCILDGNEEIAKGTPFKIVFPEGFSMPQTIESKYISINGLSAVSPISVEGRTITLPAPSAVKGALTVTIFKGAGITNPGNGKYGITIDIAGKTRNCGEFIIIPFEGSITSVELSENRATLPSKVKITFTPSTQRMLDPGDIITVIFPVGSTIPTEFDKEKITVNKQPVLDASVSGMELALKMPVKVTVYEKTTIIIDIGVTNPKRRDLYTISLRTSKGDSLESQPYRIEDGPITTSIMFTDPDKPACGIWFNKPPILNFFCSRDEAKTFYQFDNGMKVTEFESSFRMPFNNEIKTIYFYSKEYGESEAVQKYEYGLDVTPPKFNVLSPKEEVIYTSTPYFDFEVERIPQNFFNHGIANTHRIADELFIMVNGEKTPVFESQMYQVSKEDEIQLKSKQRIKLPVEGENVVEFISRDFACNETVEKRTVIKDTKAPEIEILEPINDKIFVDGDEIEFMVATEPGSTVTIDGNKMKVISDNGIYSYVMKAKNDFNRFLIIATDRVGNKNELWVSVNIKPKTATIRLTLDKTDWTVNGIAQTPLKTAPTNKFPNNLKKLNGNAYMPISEIAQLLDSWISWDAKEKKVTITQRQPDGTDKTIEMWINKTTARINGREMKYDSKGVLCPAILNGKTMLPLRFVAENLGADVTFDAKEKTITIVYPKGGR